MINYIFILYLYCIYIVFILYLYCIYIIFILYLYYIYIVFILYLYYIYIIFILYLYYKMSADFDPAKVNPASIILKETIPNTSNSIDYIIMFISIILVILLYLRINKKI
jgi:hypothetical protein